jgi:signal-transduction protein with cAMP-binding, CBS, and nucleotidyltransferase domain
MLNQFASTSVAELDQRPPARISPGSSVSDAVAVMTAQRRGAVVVVDEDGMPVGIFTERDLMLRACRSDTDWQRQPIARVMTPEPRCLGATDTVAAALRAMDQGNCRHLPLLDHEGRVTGLLSIRDILAHLASLCPREFINLPPDPQREAHHRWGG